MIDLKFYPLEQVNSMARKVKTNRAFLVSNVGCQNATSISAFE